MATSNRVSVPPLGDLRLPSSNLIGGEWRGATDDARLTVTDPATGSLLGSVPDAATDEAVEAVQAAFEAGIEWRRWAPRKRSRLLLRIADHLESEADRLAAILTAEQGKPFAEARSEIDSSIEQFEWYAGEAQRAYGDVVPSNGPQSRMLVVPQPVGVVLAITPWNYPASMVARKLAPALAAGCTVVLKPAPQTPMTALAMAEVMVEAGVPPGVLNVLATDRAAAVCATMLRLPEVAKLSFTGSTEVGKHLAESAGRNLKRISLELGGNAPCLVFGDADPKVAAAGVVANKFRNAGQTCVTIDRIYVDSSLCAEFTEHLAAAAEELTVGNGMDSGTDLGPLIDREAFEKVSAHVEDARAEGAHVACGGGRLDGHGFERGYFYEPTVLTNATDSMKAVREETFGPVAPVLGFTDVDEAIRRANDTRAGLAAYVYTNSVDLSLHLAASLDYGMVGVNTARLSGAQAPFGGVKESGIGREGGHQGLAEFLELKYVRIEIDGPPERLA